MGGDALLLNRVRSILAARGLSALDLSNLSARVFGRASHYFISHNFYHDLRVGAAYPNIYQVFALSHLSNYLLVDWLRVFGLRLDDISRLQTLLNRRRTVILDSTNYDKEAWVSWFQENTAPLELHKTLPIARLVTPARAHRVRTIERWNGTSFLYARTGQEDAFAFPDLVPGSLLRVNPRVTAVTWRIGESRSSRQPYLVEHNGRLMCCRLKLIDGERVGLVSNCAAFANLQFLLGKEIRILGVADLEMHPVTPLHAYASRGLAKEWAPESVSLIANEPLSKLIGSFRIRSGLPFSKASHASKQIADEMNDSRYFMTARSLLSYERLNMLPRYIQRIISLCIIYCIPFWDVLNSAGMNLDRLGQEPIPEDLLERDRPNNATSLPIEDRDPPKLSIFPRTVLEEIPLFLRHSLPRIVGLPRLSIRDIFWAGDSGLRLHPLLEGGYFLIVNRRMKAAAQSRLSAPWETPPCLILLRNGDYICGPCAVRNGALVLHPHPDSRLPPLVFRNKKEAEIAGRIVAIVRRL